jgi:hypothetical protein
VNTSDKKEIIDFVLNNNEEYKEIQKNDNIKLEFPILNSLDKSNKISNGIRKVKTKTITRKLNNDIKNLNQIKNNDNNNNNDNDEIIRIKHKHKHRHKHKYKDQEKDKDKETEIEIEIEKEKDLGQIKKELNEIVEIVKEKEKMIGKKYEDIKDQVQDINDYNNTESKLRENLVAKVIILVLLLIIIIPILSVETISSFIVNEDTDADQYCMRVIDELIDNSLINSSSLSNLYNHISACKNLNMNNPDLSINNTQPYLLYMNFSFYEPYKFISTKYNNTEHSKFVPNILMDRYSERKKNKIFRKDYDYFVGYYLNEKKTENITSIRKNNMIIYITNNVTILILEKSLNIARSLFIGIVLMSGALFISGDATKKLISPLEKLYLKLEFLLTKNYSDPVFKKNEYDLIIKCKDNKIIKLNQLNSNDNDNDNDNHNLNHNNNCNNNNENKNISEIQIVEESMDSLAKIVSINLGQNSIYILT